MEEIFKKSFEWVCSNWQTLFSGIGISVIALIVRFFKKNDKNPTAGRDINYVQGEATFNSGDVINNYQVSNDKTPKKLDIELFEKTRENVKKEKMEFFKLQDFGGKFKIDHIIELERFISEQDSSEFEFFNEKVEEARNALMNSMSDFLEATRFKKGRSGVTYVDGTNDFYRVQYDYDNPEPGRITIEDLNNLGNVLYEKSQEFIRVAKKELYS